MSIEPYIATRKDIESDASSETDPQDANWLKSYPQAQFFGVDGEICAAFVKQEDAEAWLAGLLN